MDSYEKGSDVMKCPKCGSTLPENAEVCPACHTPVKAGAKPGAETLSRRAARDGSIPQDTGRFSAIDPSKDTYDFDLQYTLTFKDAGEIRQAIADMELGLDDRAEQLLHPERSAAPPQDKPPHRQRSLEEMEAAAQRAALRRERRNQGKRGTGLRKRSEHTTRRGRTEEAALRAAKAPRQSGGSGRSRRLAIGAAVAVVVVALIVGSINLFASMMQGDMTYPTVYTKGNQLYLVYDKKPQLLSENLISAYAAPAPVTTEPERDEDEDEDEDEDTGTTRTPAVQDPKVYTQETATERQLIHVSQDGLYTFFLEGVDLNNGRGDLVYYKNDSPKSREVVASGVYYKLKTSGDGKAALYLQNTDDTGYHGDLYYWSPDLKEPQLVEQDICADNFVFSQDGSEALYIKNFNPIVNTGDLCIRGFGKAAGDAGQALDEKVAFVFGTTPKSDIYLYAKDYDTKTGVYNLYAMKAGEAPVVYGENAFLPPVLLTRSEAVYAYSNYHDNFQTISHVDLAAGRASQLAEEVTEIARVRNDEGAVIYTKTYETNRSDYYVVGLGDTSSQKIANAVAELPDGAQGKVQFDASDDFSRIVYIGGYDENLCRGPLFTLNIINGYAGTERRISDDAYGCDVSADGAVVRFASSFNPEAGTVNLVAYTNSNTVTLTENVGVGAFTYDQSGEVMVYARNVQTDPVTTGDVECVTTKGKIRQIDTGVQAYGLKKDGRILLLKQENGVGVLYDSNQKGSRIKEIDQDVTGALLY